MTLKYSEDDWQEQLERWKDEYGWLYERKKEGEKDVNLEPSAKRGDCKACGREAASIAATLLHLNRPDEAREWFATAGQHMTEMAHIENEHWDTRKKIDLTGVPIQFVRGLCWALLSGDEEVIGGMASETKGLDEWFVDEVGDLMNYHRPRALAALAVGDADASDRIDTVGNGDRKLDRAITAGGRGLLAGDRAQIEEGATLWANIHADLYDDKDPMGTKAVAFGAATLLVLARRQGIDATVESDYLPQSVYDLP